MKTEYKISSDKELSYAFCMKWILLRSAIMFFFISCEEFVEIDAPETSLSSQTVFNSDATATAAIVGIYENMAEESNGFASGAYSVTLLTGLSSDEFLNHSTNVNQAEFYNNELLAANSLLQILWSDLFNHIYTANAVLEGLRNSNGISLPVRIHLEGEAKFIRAFCNFYLANTFGEVPLLMDTDYKNNGSASRASIEIVYDQIIADLKDAQNLMNEDYESSERSRPNQLAATALLARVYLYRGDWVNAEAQATSVINNPLYAIETDLEEVFLKESKEAIWQLQPVLPQWGVFDAYYLIITSTPRRVSISDALINSFEEGDLRKDHWIGNTVSNGNTYYYPFKYKESFTDSPTTLPSEYLMILRLAEQFLIRAEARSQQNNISGAQEDLNYIRSRAGLSNTSASDKASLLLAIEQENRIEFFAEWGHRWLDLKRTNRADVVLGSIKGSSWQLSVDTIYPIPQNELKLNPNLLPQNNGY